MEATMKYEKNADNYERISLAVPKGRKAIIKKRAESQGMSISAYVSVLIERDMPAD